MERETLEKGIIELYKSFKKHCIDKDIIRTEEIISLFEMTMCMEKDDAFTSEKLN